MPQLRIAGPLYLTLLLSALVLPQAAQAGFTIGPDASNYGVLFEGGGNNTLQITNVTVNGNIGVGNTGKLNDSGPATINGGIYFSAANTAQFANSNGSNVLTGGVSYSVSQVTTALNTVNSLNTTLGAESGTGVLIAGTMAINASSGTLHNGDRVFSVTSFNTTNGDVLTINGDGAGDNVVLNFTGSVNFNNQVVLNGISADHVLFNFVGGSALSGGPTLQINDNASSSSSNSVSGIFLDPNGSISVTNSRVFGRVFGGDSHDFQFVSGDTLTAPMSSVPEPSHTAVVLGLMLAIAVVVRRRLTPARTR